MERYQVILAYDGTEFSGFQRQASGKNTDALYRRRTVQGTLESALQKIGWQGRSILIAGRTDAGVHASGQVAAFDLDWVHSEADLQAALNANLPLDMAVQAVRQVQADFHPRYDALSRCYRYQIFCQPVRDPLRERYAWRVWPAVSLDRLQQAATYLVGTHDFAAFGTPPRAGGVTIRQVFQAGWQQQQDSLVFEIRANAFLYRMARRLVGFQVKIGQGLKEPEAVKQHLEDRLLTMVKEVAPACGLTLVEVVYA
jgi:tRNA pseudouridine38-40 synthase